MKKRLIVCLDGTWNTPDGGRNPTNVVRIMRAIRPMGADGVPQITFYDAGVGTTGTKVSRALAGAIGRGLDQNVQDGYRFLAHNWQPGDEVYVFGFSRGAFTARSLCGFVSAVGLLEKEDLGRLPAAWALYRKPKEERAADPMYDWFARNTRREMRVKCLGVWDTVGALGVPGEPFEGLNMKHRFHDAELSAMVECGFHALAIDEKRAPFEPTLWQKPKDSVLPQRVVEQVWFPGVHANVGGGVPDAGLPDLALHWMIDRVRAHSALAFNDGFMGERTQPDPIAEIYESRSLLYTFSHVLPYQRLIGQAEVEGSMIRSIIERRNRPAGDGCEFVNEMIHWSAAARFGQTAVENGKRREYRPANLEAAFAAGVPVVSPTDQKRPVDPVLEAVA